ncbi:uncharacterized protein LOC115229913 isoform X1 [Octopus sinensis]|uniref:Uncharacterized protein LOC115215946 isoform X1 n=2 Tax=Octopus sinensis TaxID=2607531 RepID=A0A6P7TUQ6_9MOLL|nr:uncharacterized protein LOC115215946 isoform X1 [Octopus sinensis]XP_029656034.1 uncharacterized protein LOC115229913 isoform X1 [Octopus sinensis]
MAFKKPVCQFIVVVSIFFLLVAWHQYTANKQYTVTTSSKHNQKLIDETRQKQKKNLSLMEQKLLQLNNKTKYVIFRCVGRSLCGGWGDRQHGIISVYLMALTMGRRFGIIISRPCDISKYLQPNKVNWKIDSKELHGLKSRYLNLVDGNKYISSLQSADLETLYPEDVLYVSTNRIFFYVLKKNARYKEQLLWASQKSYGNIFAKVMNLLFRFSDLLQAKFDKFFEVNIPKTNMHLVCAQIRIGKNPSVPGDNRRNSMSDVQNVWNFLSKYNNTSKYKIFVTTDSKEVQDIASKKFSSQFMYTSGEIIHVDRLRKGVKDTCDALRKILMDQYILTKCDTLLVSRSGFGENALLMREKENNIFHFKNGKVTRINIEKFFPGWEKTWL